MKNNITIDLPDWIYPFIETKEIQEEQINTKTGKITNITKIVPKYRFCIAWGGRGSGKTYAIAALLLSLACQKKIVVVCSRSIKGSIADSVHAVLKLRIDEFGLTKYFKITREKITCLVTGSEFIFKGLLTNVDNLKGIPVINYIWIEEADSLTRHAWETLKPSTRADNSQIFISINPRNKTDCIYKDFISEDAPKDSQAYVCYVHWSANNYFNRILNDERLRCMKNNPDMYQHIWEGALLEHSHAQIFYGKWCVQSFTEDKNVQAYYGLDFGYSVDATAAIRCYIEDNNLYITHEFYSTKIEIDETGIKCEKAIPDFKYNKIMADSARPETISYMKRQGYRVQGAKKGKGSIEDGIAFIRSFDKVIIHPRCENIINEFNLYSYKVDTITDDITTKIVDKHNHCIDALRYALEPLIKGKYANYKILAKL